MADTFTTNLNLTKPEPGAAGDTWGISLNSNLDTIDGLFGSSGSTVNFGSVQVAGTNGVNIQQGAISIKNGGTQSRVDFYCESSNAHYARLQAPAHSAFSGNVTLTLPASTGSLVGTGDSGTVTNTMLAGSIANAKLANSSATLNSQTLTLGSSLTLDTDNIGEGSSNLYFTNERVDDRVNALLVAGSNITLTYDDAGNTLTIAASGGGSGTVTEAFKTISVSGQDNIVADSATDTLTVAAGSGITLTTNASTDTLTITNSGSASNSFETIAVSGQSNVVADSGTDTLTLVAGSNMTITTNASTDTITFASTASGSGGSSSSFTKNTFTGDGSTTAFTLSKSVSNEDNLIVFIDAAYQADNVYSVSGTTLTFATAPVNTRLIEVFIIEGGIVGTAPVIDTMTGDGSDTTLALSTTPASENQTFVTIDGVVQHKSTYSVSGSTLTFSEAPPNSSAVECITFVNVALATFQDADGDTKIQLEESADEDKIRFDTAGSERVIIDNAGKVGVGTTSPTANLHVSGSSAQKIDITDTSGASTRISTANSKSYVGSTTNHPLLFLTNDTERMRIDTSGNVGIGASSPNYPLTIHNSGDGIKFEISDLVDANYRIQVSGNDILTGPSTASDLIFQTGNTERMRIDSNGNLGLGTSSPTQRLHVDGGSALIKSSYDASGTTNVYQYFATRASGNWRNSTIGNTGNSLVFGTGGTGTTHTNATERMRIDSAGEIHINKTATINNGQLEILAQASHQAIVAKVQTDTNQNFLGYNSSGQVTSYIQGNGNYYFSGTSQSDRDLKENIQSITESSLAKVKQLEPKTFNFKESEGFKTNKKTGFIAQEVTEIFGTENGVATGTDGKKDMGIDSIGLIAHLTKAIQELSVKVEELEGKIE